MKRTLRRGIALLLAAFTAAPVYAQTQMRLTIPPAAQGELVVVSLRDGRSIAGEVGPWKDSGFYVYPRNEPGILVRTEEIVAIHNAGSGAPRAFPDPVSRARMTGSTKATIAFAVLGALILVGSQLRLN